MIMRRTIKFRAQRLDNGKWVYGDLEHNPGNKRTRIHSYDSKGIYKGQHIVNPESIGQFTGLLDCNGKEIYEGDILTVNGKYPRVVLWDKMCWALMPTEYFHDEIFWVMNLQHPGIDWWEEFADRFEVIGNVFDNSNLLQND